MDRCDNFESLDPTSESDLACDMSQLDLAGMLTRSGSPDVSPYTLNAHRLTLTCAVVHGLICAGIAAYTSTWMLWLTIAVPAVLVPASLVKAYPRALLTRLAMAFGFMSLTELTIEQCGGEIEAHFSFFIMISILVAYHDWLVLVCALLTLVLHHLGFTVLQATGSGLLIWNDNRNIWSHLIVHGVAATIQTAALCYLAVILRDRFELASQNATLSRSLQEAATRASHDPLTGLFNRRYLDDMVTQIGSSSDGARRLATLCVIDLDHFKTVNDRLGHSAGDAVLRDVSATILNNLGPKDFAVRYGGEEFLVVIRNLSPGAGILFAEFVRTELASRPIQTDEGSVSVTASFGLATWRQAELFADAFTRADLAVYQAKSSGRNCVKLDQDIQRSESTFLAFLLGSAPDSRLQPDHPTGQIEQMTA